MRVCLPIKAMAKIVFKIAVNVTPLMLSYMYVENFWLCEYSKTVSDLFIILLLLQTFLVLLPMVLLVLKGFCCKFL